MKHINVAVIGIGNMGSAHAACIAQNQIEGMSLTAELATRFLADYILGDLYFKINSPDHNLVRTRCQIALAKDMQKHMAEMEQIVRDCITAD